VIPANKEKVQKYKAAKLSCHLSLLWKDKDEFLKLETYDDRSERVDPIMRCRREL